MKTLVCAIAILLLGLPVPMAHCQELEKGPNSQLFKMLDGNRDGQLDPYETLDVLIQVQAQLDGQKLTARRIESLLKDQADSEREEISEMLKDMDRNGDGKTTLDEMDEDSREIAQMLDKNNDGTISVEEASFFEMSEEFFMSSEDIQEQVNGVFAEFDKDKDGHLTKNEATNEEFSWSQMSEGDSNGDGRVTKAEMTAFLAADNQKAVFKINSNTAVMTGVINSDTPAAVLRLIHEHPKVRTIEMENVPGSIDDEANLRAARYVRKFGFTTVIKYNGSVASGGTDFFLAGQKRIVEKGGKLGIHSWGGPGFQGKDVPKDNPQHQLYLKYYEEIGIPAEFYWRTLEAAPANDIHWMTEKEIEQFHVRTNE